MLANEGRDAGVEYRQLQVDQRRPGARSRHGEVRARSSTIARTTSWLDAARPFRRRRAYQATWNFSVRSTGITVSASDPKPVVTP